MKIKCLYSSTEQVVPEQEDMNFVGSACEIIPPNVFVHIPMHTSDDQPISNKSNHPLRQDSREIKSEPFKTEGTLQQLPQNSEFLEETGTNLITARPKNPVKCFKCSFCPFISISGDGLRNHIDNFHLNPADTSSSSVSSEFLIKKLFCPGCENVFYTNLTLECHLENDHQMTKAELQPLLESVTQVTPAILPEPRKGKISLKNVDALRNPISENNVEETEDCPINEDDMLLIDLLDSGKSIVIDDDDNIDHSKTISQNKIYVKNVDILRPDVSTADSQIVQNGYLNFNSDYISENVNFYHNSNFENIQTKDNINIQQPENNDNGPRRAKIYIKNVDILKEPIIVPPNYLSNMLNMNNDLSLNVFSSTYDLSASEPTTKDHFLPPNLGVSDIHHETNSSSKICIKNIDILKEPDFQNIPRRSTNSLHLRTVDELNLMNMNEVQGLIAPVLDQSFINQENFILPDQNSQNRDDDILNQYNSFSDLIYNQNNNFVEAANDQANWSEDYNLEVFDNITDISSSSFIDFEKNRKSGNEFITNISPQQQTQEYTNIKDVMLECAQEFINNSNDEKDCQSKSFESDMYINKTCYFDEQQKTLDENVVDIIDDLEEQNFSRGNVAQTEKGRIYVADNLVEQRIPNDYSEITVKKCHGRPFGSKQTGITKLKKMYKNLTPNEIGFKCDMDCGIRFRKQEILEYHRNCHFPPDQTRMQCPECFVNDFRSWNTLHTHLWRIHQIDMELYSCDYCNFKTPILSRLLNTHAKIHSQERNFSCEVCNKAFKNSKQLKNHRRTHRFRKEHAEPKCSICLKVLSSKSALRLHSLTHEEQSKHKCENCTYTTNDHNAFRRHKMSHNDEKLYSCIFCDYKCIQSSLYKKHILRKHPDNASQVILKCNMCTFATINLGKYEIHVQKHKNINHELKPELKNSSSQHKKLPNESPSTNSHSPILIKSTLSENKIKVKSNLGLGDPTNF